MTLLPRRPRRTCRVCAVDSGESDLCPSCRHAAAEAARRKAAERVQRERAQEDEARRHREWEAEIQVRKQREAEHAERTRQELARRVEAERAQAGQTVRAVPIGSAASTVTGDEGPFDPYAVLNVPREVCTDLIVLAYRAAKKRYDPQVADFCSDEVKAHFKAKADAIDRAYDMLVHSR